MYREEDFTDWTDDEPKDTGWVTPPDFLSWFVAGLVIGYVIGAIL